MPPGGHRRYRNEHRPGGCRSLVFGRCGWLEGNGVNMLGQGRLMWRLRDEVFVP